jgi:peroxin-7
VPACSLFLCAFLRNEFRPLAVLTAGRRRSRASPPPARALPDTGRCELTLGAHEADVLSVDWHKYAPHVLASASVDQTVRLWDLRRPAAPTAVLRGHRLAVRRARFSPHDSRLLLSAAYDMSAAVWDVGAPPGAPPLGTFAHHTEFVVGAEWSLFQPGLFATVSWDGAVALVQAPSPPSGL